MRKLVDRFTAVDEKGNKHTISCFQEFRTQTYLSGNSETSAGLREFRCDSGAVNMIDDNTFEIVATQTEVKKVA